MTGWATAGTTGSLKGSVTDEQGSPLPGATVTVASATQLGGTRSVRAGAGGTFDLPALDPGSFSVKVELDGFLTHELTGVQVRLDRTTEIRVELQPGQFAETVVVTAEAAVIDPEQVSISRSFTEDYLQKSTVGNRARSYQRVLSQSAGVAGAPNPNVFGSTASENAWYIDGFNTTDPVTSTFAGNYSFDVIQEISFSTAGFEAELGNATGGVINVITKSGGNSFAGTFDVRYFDESFFENGEFFDRERHVQKLINPSVTLGGPIVQDRLWFFGAYNPVESRLTPAGAPTTRTFKGDYWLAKLSWQLRPGWRLVSKASGDPTDIENAASSPFRPPETQTLQEQGGELYQLDLAAMLAPNLLADLRFGIHRLELNNFPMSRDLETPGHLNISTQLHSVNHTNAQFSDRDRDFLSSGVSWLVDGPGGSHELKTGIEYSDTFFRSRNFTVGDYLFTRRIVNEHDIVRNFTHDPNRDVSQFEGSIVSSYLQDSWNPRSDLTIKLGIRFDRSEYDDNLGAQTAGLDKLQPRLGVAWDMTGDGKTIGRASWGRFMHPSALTAASFAQRGVNERPITIAWSCGYIRQFTFGLPATDSTPCTVLAGILAGAFGFDGSIVQEPQGLDPEGWIVSNVIGGAGIPNRVDPDLEATFQDSFILGIERQVYRRTSMELSYIRKHTKDIFEDTCNGAFPDPSPGHACDFFFMANLPVLRRDYEGVLLRAESRAADWLQVASSLTWSESTGNVEYTQNAGADFDFFPDHYANTFGFLSDHREWRFKLNGYVDLPMDFGVGFDAFWASDSLFSNMQAAESAPYGNQFNEPRGSRKGNENYQLDLQVTKAFETPRARLQLIATVLNVFDSERPTGRCQQAAGCTDVEGNARLLGDPLNWQRPRSYEIGFRLEF